MLTIKVKFKLEACGVGSAIKSALLSRESKTRQQEQKDMKLKGREVLLKALVVFLSPTDIAVHLVVRVKTLGRP